MRNDFATVPALRPFLVTIGPLRGEPRMQFACMAPSSMVAFDQHFDMAEEGERVEITAADRAPLSILCKEQELAEADLRDARNKAQRAADRQYAQALDVQLNHSGATR